MKFFCEYCGNMIDANTDDKCLNCGAAYNKNKTFIKLQEERKKEKQINQENKQKIFNHVLGTLKFSRVFMLIPIVIFIIVFIVIVSIFISIRNAAKSQIENNKNNDIEFKQEMNIQQEEQDKVVANFDEFAQTENYRVKVNKYEVEEDKFNRVDEEFEIVKFYLLVENLTDDEIDSEDVNCVVDGIAQNNKYYSGHSDLPFRISKGLTVKGTASFEVPKNATSYEIKYGDYVTIKIDK